MTVGDSTHLDSTEGGHTHVEEDAVKNRHGDELERVGNMSLIISLTT